MVNRSQNLMVIHNSNRTKVNRVKINRILINSQMRMDQIINNLRMMENLNHRDNQRATMLLLQNKVKVLLQPRPNLPHHSNQPLLKLHLQIKSSLKQPHQANHNNSNRHLRPRLQQHLPLPPLISQNKPTLTMLNLVIHLAEISCHKNLRRLPASPMTPKTTNSSKFINEKITT